MTTRRGPAVSRPIAVAVAAGAAGAALALGALWAAGEITSPAKAQGPPAAGSSNITLSVAQLRINQRISQAAVRRSNESLNLLDPLRGSGLKGWRTEDLRDGVVTGPKLAANSVGTANLADAAVTGPKLAAESVGATNLTTGLANQLPVWAVVNPAGGLVKQRGAANSQLIAAGVYRVTFGRDVTACSYVGNLTANFGEVFVFGDPANASAVIVATGNSAGTTQSHAFSVHVLC